MARKKHPSYVSAVGLVFLVTLTLFTLPVLASEQTTTDRTQLADANPTNAILQYNASSDLVKASDYPRARLYLERAALLAPDHPAIRHNLDLIREVIVYNATSKRHPRFTESLSGWQTAASIPKSTLHTIFITTLWLAFLALLVHRIAAIKPSDRTAQLQTVASVLLWILMTVFVLNVAVTSTRAFILHSASPAIIVANTPALREGPSTYAALTRTSHRTAPGMMVNILETRDDWQKVEISDHAQGWMQADDIVPIITH